MAEETKCLQTVRKFVEACDKGDLETAKSYLTDEFLCNDYGIMQLKKPRSWYDAALAGVDDALGDRKIEIVSLRGNETFAAMETITKFVFKQDMPGYLPEGTGTVVGKRATIYDCMLFTFDPEKGKFTESSDYSKFILDS